MPTKRRLNTKEEIFNMAKIYKTTGEVIEVEPKNGKDFKLEELKEIVHGYIELVNYSPTQYMVVNEEGHPLGLPLNLSATILYNKDIIKDDIVGDVLICNKFQIKSIMDTNAMNPMPELGGSVSHPSHYANQGIEPRKYISVNKLDFNQGNIVKYVTRHKTKDGARDIIKVITYARFILEEDYGMTPDQIEDIMLNQIENCKAL